MEQDTHRKEVGKDTQHNNQNKHHSLYFPTSPQQKEIFFGGTMKDIGELFSLDTEAQQLSAGFFMSNADHGIEHEYNVYQRAQEIADIYEKMTGVRVRRHMIYPMAICHDAARSFKLPESDPHKTQKEKNYDRNHEKYGAVLFRYVMQKLRRSGYDVHITPHEQSEIEEYLMNHDYFSKQLNGGRFHEPPSLEGQIVMLADRTSVDLKDEIQRYWDTGKRLGSPFFITQVPWEERENMSFDRLGEYIHKGWADEVMFFTALLMIKPSDFSNPILGELYAQRAQQKQDAVSFILEIAEHEHATTEQKKELRALLSYLGKKFGFIVSQS